MALHPFFTAMVENARAAGRPALSAGTPQQARELVAAGRAVLGAGAQMGQVHDLQIVTRAGTVPSRLYRPLGGAELGLVVYLHGGGWVCGSVDDFDVLTRALADRSRCAVLSVDYRLAPEHPFPAGLEDAQDALLWASAQTQSLLGHRVPLVVAGDSAGANLATVAAAALRGRVQIALQCLLYPVTDTDFERDSYRRHGEGLPLTAVDMRWFTAQYAEHRLWSDPRIAPIRHPQLAGSPPAWIATAEYDVLCDEGEAYAEALQRAGVPVTSTRVPSLAHGFARLLNHLPEASAVLDAAAAEIRRACSSATASSTLPSHRSTET